jgi:hypothetical protein
MYVKPTPEEQAKRTAKSVATRQANIAIRNAQYEDAYARRHLLKGEIEALESKLEKLKHIDTLNELSNKVSSKTLLQEKDLVSAAKPWQSFAGIYFLVHKDRVIYVGQSVNVYARISSHTDKVFDRFTVLPCAKSNLNLVESLYIHTLQPPLNGGNGKATLAPLSLEKIMAIANKKEDKHDVAEAIRARGHR